ncbi:cupin domain-containing protein [Thalassococcus lentus]|uniref:Cupin domain-containing protein n=1 Tax=Thalassococcus lentus TaxID=1210524 RepID=A0ABT4XXL8_9RHOB|nr:hypothetical protein [Thalassococcus lentus]MDA7426627.1 hypothetical protein [Thalassococcus lentus]
MKKAVLSALCLVATSFASEVSAQAQEAETGEVISLVTKINGQTPPGRLAHLVDVETMIDTIMPDGNRLVVMKGIRKAGTRVGIHVHKYGGHTCVLSGAITDFVEGIDPGLFPAGTCYYMPSDTPMTAANLGTEDAMLIDTFILPPGEETITILEPGY